MNSQECINQLAADVRHGQAGAADEMRAKLRDIMPFLVRHAQRSHGQSAAAMRLRQAAGAASSNASSTASLVSQGVVARLAGGDHAHTGGTFVAGVAWTADTRVG